MHYTFACNFYSLLNGMKPLYSLFSIVDQCLKFIQLLLTLCFLGLLQLLLKRIFKLFASSYHR